LPLAVNHYPLTIHHSPVGFDPHDPHRSAKTKPIKTVKQILSAIGIMIINEGLLFMAQFWASFKDMGKNIINISQPFVEVVTFGNYFIDFYPLLNINV